MVRALAWKCITINAILDVGDDDDQTSEFVGDDNHT